MKPVKKTAQRFSTVITPSMEASLSALPVSSILGRHHFLRTALILGIAGMAEAFDDPAMDEWSAGHAQLGLFNFTGMVVSSPGGKTKRLIDLRPIEFRSAG